MKRTIVLAALVSAACSVEPKVDVTEGSVTPEKISAGAITAEKLAPDSVLNEAIADGAVTGGKIAAGAIEPGHFKALGPGSNLDADLLDGRDSARFVWTDPASPQAGGFDLAGAGRLGGGLVAAGVETTDLDVTGDAAVRGSLGVLLDLGVQGDLGVGGDLQAAGAVRAGSLTTGALLATDATVAGLSVQNDLQVAGALSAGRLAVGAIESSDLVVRLVSAEEVRVAGSLGIGTATPADKLDVAGAVRMTHLKGPSGLIMADLEGSFLRIWPGSRFESEITVANNRALQWINAAGTTNVPVLNLNASDALELHKLGGSPRMVVLADGNVGIGTTTPDNRLTVVGGNIITTGEVIAGRGMDTVLGPGYVRRSGGPRISFGEDTAAPAFELDTINAYGTSPLLSLKAAGAAVLTVDKDGEFGIGTAAPASALHIYKAGASDFSQISFQNDLNTVSHLTLGMRSSLGGLTVRDAVAGADLFHLQRASDGGNLGVGTVTPGARLELKQSANDTTGGLRLSAAGSANHWNLHHFGAGENFGISRNNAAAPFVTVLAASGNVGVGTSAPSARLHIVGGDVVIGNPTIHDASTAEDLFIKGNLVVDGRIVQHMGGANSFDDLSVNGRVGIGAASPDQKLHVAGGRLLLEGFGTNYGMILGGPSNARAHIRLEDAGADPAGGRYGDLVFAGSNAGSGYEAMRIQNASGNVGIGTTTPLARLQVNTIRPILLDNNGGFGVYGSHIGFNADLDTINVPNKFIKLGGTSQNGAAAIVVDNAGNMLLQTYYAGTEAESIVDYGPQFAFGTTGNFGIGITNPGSKLHIYDSSGTVNPRLTIESNHANVYYPGIDIKASDVAGENYSIFAYKTTGLYFDIPASRAIVLRPGGTEVMRVTSGAVNVDGSVGHANVLAHRETRFGYPGAYRVLQIGPTSGNATISLGVDPSANPGGSFDGTGGEILVRNGMSFLTPNSSGTNFHRFVMSMKDGAVGIGTENPLPGQGRLTLGKSDGTTGGALFVYSSNIAGKKGLVSAYNGSLYLDSDANGSNPLYLNWGGGGGAGAVVANGSGSYGPIAASAFNINSSRAVKRDIAPSRYGLKEVLRMQPVAFAYKADHERKKHIGLIAEEVQQLVPEAVSPVKGPGTDSLGVDYGKLTVVLVQALKEQQAEIARLQKRLSALESKLARSAP